MKLIKRVFLGLIVLVLALVGIAYLLPSKANVSRSININAPSEAIFPYPNSMQQTEHWSPWLHRDPETKLTYSGPELGGWEYFELEL